MSFFQNPHSCDFHGIWVLGDRHLSPEFRCYGNKGRGDEMVVVWEVPPYDLSGNDVDTATTDTLVIKYALYNSKNWNTLSINIASGAASASAVTPAEIIGNLNNDATFSTFFTASLGSLDADVSPISKKRVVIRQNKPVTQFKFYIVNGRAEEKLKFNKKAGVAELPTYFDRHSVGNHVTFSDGQSLLVPLTPGTYDVDANVIDDAIDAHGVSLGLTSGVVQADYKLLKGRSGIFNFQKITVDSSDRITQIIEYQAGAIAGDLGRKIQYTYTAAKTKPDQITEIPHTLSSGDFVTPA